MWSRASHVMPTPAVAGPWLTTSSRQHLQPDEVAPGMEVERVAARDEQGNRQQQRGRVMGRSGLRVRADFSESGGPPSTWVPAVELRAVQLPPSTSSTESQLEPEPEKELMVPPASPVPVPTPRSRQRTMEMLQLVDKQIRSEHVARSRAHSEVEASEQEAGALDAELRLVCDELARLRTPPSRRASDANTATSGSPRDHGNSVALKGPSTPASSSPATRRWRTVSHVVRTPNWLSTQVRDELNFNIGHTSKQGNARAHPNEDRVVVECNVAKRGVMLLAVIDGHGGSGVADLLQARLASAISAMPAFQSSPPDLPNAIRQAFRWCNAQCRTAWKETAEGSGACVVMALIVAEGVIGRRRCVVGWVGDSRAVLCDRNGGVVGLTQDHDPDEPAERERILAAGGIVTQEGRVQVAVPMPPPVAPGSTMLHVGKSHSGLSLAGSPVDSPAVAMQRQGANVVVPPRAGRSAFLDSDSDSESNDGCVIRQVAVARDIGDTLLEARLGGGAAAVSDSASQAPAVATEGQAGSTVNPEIISCEPDITEVTLEAGRDALLILGSDGLFAPLQNDTVGGLAYSLWRSASDANGDSGVGGTDMIKPKVLATKLVQKAKRVRGNSDDTTALVLRLTRAAPGEPAGALDLDSQSDTMLEDDDLSLRLNTHTELGNLTGSIAAGRDLFAEPVRTSMSLPAPTQPPILTTHKAERAATVSLATPRAIGTPRQTPPRAGSCGGSAAATATASGRRRHRSIGAPL